MSGRAQPSIRLAVVGGGISGLAAAYRLRQLLPDAQLTVFEAGGRLGGPLYTERRGELLLEHGADNFIAKTPWAVALCRELGLGDELVPTNAQHRRALVVHRGRLYPVPDGFVIMQPRRWGPLLRSRLLSLAGKARALTEPWISAPAGVGTPGYDESVASFASRRLGREAFERLVEPLMAGIYVADATELSLAATMPEFLEAERTHGSLRRAARATSNGRKGDAESGAGARYESFFTLRRGMSSLVEALAAALPEGCIQMRSPVVELSKAANHGWQLRVQGREAEKFDGVVLATPAPHAGELVDRIDPQLGRLLTGIEYASSAVVTLVYRREALPRPLEAFGFVVPRVEKRPLLAASFPSVKFPGRAPAELTPIRTFLGGALHPEVMGLADDELVALAHRELSELVGVREPPVETAVARWAKSMPQYHVGHVQQAGAIEYLAGTHRGLALAGNGYRGVGIPQCIKSGQDAAERLATELAPARL